MKWRKTEKKKKKKKKKKKRLDKEALCERLKMRNNLKMKDLILIGKTMMKMIMIQ